MNMRFMFPDQRVSEELWSIITLNNPSNISDMEIYLEYVSDYRNIR